VTIFILYCVLIRDLLYAYKPRYKEELPISALGVIVFPWINYDSTQYPSGLCGLKNQVTRSEYAKHCGFDAIIFRHIWGIKFTIHRFAQNRPTLNIIFKLLTIHNVSIAQTPSPMYY